MAAGTDTTASRVSSRSSGSWPPLTAERACETSRDSLLVSTGSPPPERTIDRWVAVRW